MILIVIVLSIVIIALGWVIYNLNKKLEKLEDVINGYLNYINTMSQLIEYSSDKLKKIDATEKFKSDDEIGWFFDNVKRIQNLLDKFILENGEKK